MSLEKPSDCAECGAPARVEHVPQGGILGLRWSCRCSNKECMFRGPGWDQTEELCISFWNGCMGIHQRWEEARRK